GIAKIDHDIAGADVFRYVITEIEARGYFHARLSRSGSDRLAHPAFRTQQQNPHRRIHSVPAKASSVLRRRAWFAAVISHKGSRHSADITPRQESAVFTGTGFGSMKRSLKIGNIFRCMSCALFVSPERKAWTSATTSAGNKFEATLT